MEDFTITSQLTPKKYAKVMFIGLYKKPVFILMALFGLYLITTVLLDHFNVIKFYTEVPYFEIFSGLFLLLLPTIAVIIALRQFLSNPNFKNEVKYTFGGQGMAVQGTTFKGEFLWAHMIKYKEINNFLILYHTKQMGNYIDKTKLTPDQLDFIKSKVGRK